MNLYSLFQLSSANIVSDLSLGALVLSAIGILGKIWVPHLGFFSRVIIGASFIAAIVSGIVGINAKFGHYFINISIGISFLAGFLSLVQRIYRRKVIFRLNQDYFWGLLVTLFLVVLSIFRLQHLSSEGVLLNAHEAYYLGVPVEINQADYTSRLRILDYYPYEWSRYHFFSSSILAIPLSVMTQQNLSGFLIAKSLIVAFLVGAALELSKLDVKLKFAAVPLAFYCYLFIFEEATRWSLNTTNFLSVAFLILIFISIQKSQFFYAGFCCLGLALSASRVIVPGLLLLMYFVFLKARRSNIGFLQCIPGIKFRKLFLYLTLLLSVISTLALGDLPTAIDSPIKSVYNFGYRAFFTPAFLFTSPDWQISMSSTSGILRILAEMPVLEQSLGARPELLEQLNHISNFSVFSTTIFWLIILYIAFFKLFQGRQSVRIELVSKKKRYRFLLFVFLIYLANVALRDYENIIWPIVLTIVPVFSLLVLSTEVFRVPLLIYIISSYMLVPLTDSSLWSAAVSLPEYLLPLFLIKSVHKKLIPTSTIVIGIVSLGFLTLSILISRIHVLNIFTPVQFDSTTQVITEKLRIPKGEVLCNELSDIEALLFAISGKRISADPYRSDRFIITKNFGLRDDKESAKFADFCETLEMKQK